MKKYGCDLCKKRFHSQKAVDDHTQAAHRNQRQRTEDGWKRGGHHPDPEPDPERVWYKGRLYRLLFLGDTKYGYRAKLGFLGGTETFWIDGDLVEKAPGPKPSDQAPGPKPSEKKLRLARHYLKLLEPSNNAAEGERSIAVARLNDFLDGLR